MSKAAVPLPNSMLERSSTVKSSYLHLCSCVFLVKGLCVMPAHSGMAAMFSNSNMQGALLWPAAAIHAYTFS